MENMRWFEISVRSAYAFAVINHFATMKLKFDAKTLIDPTSPINGEMALPLAIEKANEILYAIDQLNGKKRIERILQGYKAIYAIFAQDEMAFEQNE
jgi:hypothetical protein